MIETLLFFLRAHALRQPFEGKRVTGVEIDYGARSGALAQVLRLSFRSVRFILPRYKSVERAADARLIASRRKRIRERRLGTRAGMKQTPDTPS